MRATKNCFHNNPYDPEQAPCPTCEIRPLQIPRSLQLMSGYSLLVKNILTSSNIMEILGKL